MMTIEHQTRIAAPAMRVFLLSLSMDLHQESASQSSERAIAGVTQGIIGLNERVTWRGRHFGFMLQHETEITKYEAPVFFEDVMVRGMFKTFVHQHTFCEAQGVTTMRDTLTFAAPLGLLGRIAEGLFLSTHMDEFLTLRNQHIKKVAESDRWRRYLPHEELRQDAVRDAPHSGRSVRGS